MPATVFPAKITPCERFCELIRVQSVSGLASNIAVPMMNSGVQ